MNRIFKFFLVFIISFNCLFITVQDSFSKGLSSPEAGPRDRIRNYKIEGLSTFNSKSVIEYKYSTKYGFSCLPDGLKYFEPNEGLNNKVNGNVVAWSWDLLVNVFLGPFLCVATLNSALKTVTNKGSDLLGSIGIVLIAITTAGLEKVEELIFGEDDYNLDPTNPSCMGMYIGMIVTCIIMTVVFKITSIKLYVRIIIILSLSSLIWAAKETFGYVKYNFANKVFHKLALCGDEWLTYGNNDLKDLMDDKHIGSIEYEDIGFDYIKKYFPVKGDFLGSYKFTLNSCFQRRQIGACKILFNKTALTNSDIDDMASVMVKQYREYIYGGMEYSYSNCKDPRPERKLFSNTDDKTSQLYYFRGNESANFACDRFLVNNTEEYRDAYNCCLEASQSLICIRNSDGGHTMCDKNASAGSCSLKTSYESDDDCSDDTKVDIKQMCEKIKEQIKELSSSNTGEDKEDMSNAIDEINKVYKQYCSGNNTTVDGIPSFSDKEVASQNFCTKGSGKKITFKIKQSAYNENKYCVETYNLCPYNFRLLGGSEQSSKQFVATYDGGYTVKLDTDGKTYIEDTSKDLQQINRDNNCTFDEDGNRQCMGPCFDSNGEVSNCYNKPANFCQLDRHCVIVPDLFEKEEIKAAPYLDKACMNFIGSSHNFFNYVLPVNATNKNTTLFTAPFVECFVETFKNMLMNKAGHSKCILETETPLSDGTCISGNEYIEGENLNESSYPSPFKKIKSFLSSIVKVMMVLAVVFYGFNIIIKNEGFSRDKIIQFILTITAVSYFTFNNGWMTYIFNGTYTVMNYLSVIAMDIGNISIDNNEGADYTNNKYSGCYFFDSDNIPNNYEKYDNRKYLALFDTLDCKLSRYFGFNNEVISNPPVLSLFISGLFSFGITIIIILPFILVMMSLIFFAMRLAYQFIANSLLLTILLFFAPIMIPMVLFKKTKSYFDSWISKIIGTIFAPIMTIIGLFLFISIFEKYFIGDATFYGTKEPIRDVYCGRICKISDSNFYYMPHENFIVDDNDGNKIEEEENTKREECLNIAKGKIINLAEKAPICASIFNNNITNSSSNLFDFIIDGFIGFPALYGSAFQFYLFLSMIFLLILIFIFEEFTNKLGSINSSIFGSNLPSAKGAIPTLKDIFGTTISIFAKMSNAGMRAGKYGIATAINKYKKGSEKSATRNNSDIKNFINESKNEMAENYDNLMNKENNSNTTQNNILDNESDTSSNDEESEELRI